MTAREARNRRRAEERREAKLARKTANSPNAQSTANRSAAIAAIIPAFNPEIENEFPREFQVEANRVRNRIHRNIALSAGDEPAVQDEPAFLSEAKTRRGEAKTQPVDEPAVLSEAKTQPVDEPAVLSEAKTQPVDEPAVLSEAKTQPVDEPAVLSEAKTQPVDEPAVLSEAKTQPVDEPALLSEAKTQRRSETNRLNAQHSAGPKSPQGKLASSRNSLKHGLASGTIIVPGEDPAAFEALLHDLLEEHQPANTTEDLLIHEMAQSHWLSQRALRFQNECFTKNGVDEKRLSLFLRYQTTHHRAFHKALATLLKLKKERGLPSGSGFVSQSTALPPDKGGFVPQNDRDSSAQAQFVRKNLREAVA